MTMPAFTPAVIASPPAAVLAGVRQWTGLEKLVGRSKGVRMSEAAAVSDEAWLRSIYDSAWVPMVRLAGLLLTSTDEAEEIVQDALVAIHKRRDTFESTDHALAYLRTSVVNRCRSAHRHRAVMRRKLVPERDVQSGPEQSLDDRVRHDRVMTAMRSLPQRQQEVLVLRYYSDFSEADIADALGISRGSVKSHASRAMAALRTALADLGEGER